MSEDDVVSKPVSKRVQYIYKKFYYDKAKDRFSYLIKHAYKTAEGLNLSDNYYYYVSPHKSSIFIDEY